MRETMLIAEETYRPGESSYERVADLQAVWRTQLSGPPRELSSNAPLRVYGDSDQAGTLNGKPRQRGFDVQMALSWA